jgi:diacylglycerol kinase (ATP)
MRERLTAELRRFANTARWSWQGFAAAWASEKSLRPWALANALAAVLAFSLDLTADDRALVLALGLLVVAAELANTAVEEPANALWPGPDRRAKKTKDCASAFVALTALAAGVAWAGVLVGLP